MKIASSLLAIALVGAMALARAENVTVEAVQYPAWLDRGGSTVALTPGTALQPDDKLRTGGNARVQLTLAEGSTVRLGENAQFVVERVENRGVFRAALAVLTGAFRFTTTALRKSQQRDISIKVKNVTAGIRGTDLWGKSTDARDLVCLLEGKISVGSEGNPTVTLDQPLDFYQKPRDGSPSVAKVDAKQIEIWSAETAIAKDGAAGRVGGKWRVVAAEYPSRDPALAMNRLLRASGYPSEIGKHGDATTVVIAGLSGEDESRALMANLRTIPGIKAPSILAP
jgi:FecR protein